MNTSQKQSKNQCLTPKFLADVGRTKKFQQRDALGMVTVDDLERDGLWEYTIPNVFDTGRVVTSAQGI